MSFDFNLANQIGKILQDYGTREPKKCVFSTISDTYYHENFHSDLLAYLFSYNEAKKILINWLNEHLRLNISYSDYEDGPFPERESGRRDVTILSKNKTHAIVIENKSNDADDIEKQITRYCDDLSNKNITVDAIIYINKYSLKKPSYYDELSEKQKSILLVTQLIGENGLTENVLARIENQNYRVKAFSDELKDLFWNIIYGENPMTDEEMIEFTTYLEQEDNRKTIKNMINAYNELNKKWQLYFVSYIRTLNQTIPNLPNIKTGPYSSNCSSSEFWINGNKYHLDFYFSVESGIKICLSLLDNDDDPVPYINKIKKDLGEKWPLENELFEGHGHKTFSIEILLNCEKTKQEIKTIFESFSSVIDR